MFDAFLIEIMVIDKSLDHALVRLLEEEVRVCVLCRHESNLIILVVGQTVRRFLVELAELVEHCGRFLANLGAPVM